MAAQTNGKKPLTKTEVYRALSEKTGLTRKQIDGFFEALRELIRQHLGKRGPGTFTLPGIVRFRVVRKPATKARKGVNPFTGEEIMIKAKPARNVVRCSVVKKLKDLV